MIGNFINPFVVSVQDVSLSRAFDTIYYNTTGKTLFVAVSIRFEQSLPGDLSIARAVSGVMDIPISLSSVGKIDSQLTFFVPPNVAYQVVRQVAGAGVVALNQWTEAH